MVTPAGAIEFDHPGAVFFCQHDAAASGESSNSTFVGGRRQRLPLGCGTSMACSSFGARLELLSPSFKPGNLI